MPESNITKPNEINDRQKQKRIEDLENLYAMLPDHEPDIIEYYYNQFNGDTIKTYNHLSRGLDEYHSQPRMIIVDQRGFTPMQPTNYDEDVDNLDDLVNGGNRLQAQQRIDKAQVNQANIDPEEKKMIEKALKDDYKKEKKEIKKKKKVGTAKKHGWCG